MMKGTEPTSLRRMTFIIAGAAGDMTNAVHTIAPRSSARVPEPASADDAANHPRSGRCGSVFAGRVMRSWNGLQFSE